MVVGIGSANGSEIIGNLKIQHGILGECIEQLKASELSRATLISYLREALNEQVHLTDVLNSFSIMNLF